MKDWNDQKRSFTLTIPYSRSPKISNWRLYLKKCVCWAALLLNGGYFFSCFWEGQRWGLEVLWWGVLVYAKLPDDPADGLFG